MEKEKKEGRNPKIIDMLIVQLYTLHVYVKE